MRGAPLDGGLSEPLWDSRNPIVHPDDFIPTPRLCAAAQSDRRSLVVPLYWRLARRRKDGKMVSGTVQSETPAPPKVDFETGGPKAGENGLEIVSTERAKNSSATSPGNRARI